MFIPCVWSYFTRHDLDSVSSHGYISGSESLRCSVQKGVEEYKHKMCSRYWVTLWLQWSHLMRVTAAEGGCGLWVRPFQPWLTHNCFSWICCAVQHITLAGQKEAVHNIASIKLSSFFSHFCFKEPRHNLFRLTWAANHSNHISDAG